MWEEEHDLLLQACRRSDSPWWADVLLLLIPIAVGAWLIVTVL